MSLLDKVFVVAENASVIDEVCAAGRTCGQKVEMVLIGSQEDAKRAISVGADKVYYLGEATVEKRVEDFLPTIAALIDQEKPAAIIFRTTVRGRLMAARLAAVLGTSVLTDASSLQVDGTALISKKRVYGGAALREEKAVGPVSVVCISPGIAAPLEADSSREGEIIEVAFIEPTRKVKCIETKAKVGEQVNLPAAKRVICVGRGMEAQDDLNMIYELASLLGAEVGCTRPIAEGEHWMSKERYVGVSGVMLKPELYIGVGISGQIQHMVGTDQAGTIVAINNDKKAPIFQYADYGIVDDLYTAVPALMQKFKDQ
jgi:electron transfer flavoprotein alpha subunit